MMTQTGAIFLDAYRELNSKKLFWITLVLSVLIVGVFAALGINERGLTFFWWQFDTSPFDSTIVPPELLYKYAFANFAIPIWLAWAATILALVSTASIFPEFIASGGIELTLCKPISRLRLFLLKYCTGLFFVGLQVLVFTLACFLVIGIRGDAWEPRLFLAVPVMLVFFSYLFSVCTLLGLLTRSTIASLMLTMVLWLLLWGLNTTDGIFLMQRETSFVNAERAAKKVEKQEAAARRELDGRRERGEPVPGEGAEPLPAQATDSLEAVNVFLRKGRADAEEAAESARNWRRYSDIMTTAKTAVPKTEETLALLDRWLLSTEDKKFFGGNNDRNSRGDDDRVRFGEPDPEVVARMEEAVRDRTLAWVLGTSLFFEAGILGIAAWIFCRRDF